MHYFSEIENFEFIVYLLSSICCSRSDKVVLFAQIGIESSFFSCQWDVLTKAKLDWNCFQIPHSTKVRGVEGSYITGENYKKNKCRFCFWVHARGFKKVCVQLSYCVWCPKSKFFLHSPHTYLPTYIFAIWIHSTMRYLVQNKLSPYFIFSSFHF